MVTIVLVAIVQMNPFCSDNYWSVCLYQQHTFPSLSNILASLWLFKSASAATSKYIIHSRLSLISFATSTAFVFFYASHSGIANHNCQGEREREKVRIFYSLPLTNLFGMNCSIHEISISSSIFVHHCISRVLQPSADATDAHTWCLCYCKLAYLVN